MSTNDHLQIKRKRFSWRRGADYSGLRRLPATYDLRNGSEDILATAQQDTETDLWFWYGDHINTAHRLDSLENVKAEAVEHFKGPR